MFTVEAAVIAAALAGWIAGWRLVLVWLGILASMVAVVAASLVVIPQLGSGRRLERDSHFIYFGNLQFWQPDALATKLAELSDAEQITQLSVQLTRTSTGNWRKYILLRAAVVSALTGALLLVLAFAWPPMSVRLTAGCEDY